jgi:hypothetical protein
MPSAVRSMGKSVRTRADCTACPPSGSAARWRAIAALAPSQISSARPAVTSTTITADTARPPQRPVPNQASAPSPQASSSSTSTTSRTPKDRAPRSAGR